MVQLKSFESSEGEAAPRAVESEGGAEVAAAAAAAATGSESAPVADSQKPPRWSSPRRGGHSTRSSQNSAAATVSRTGGNLTSQSDTETPASSESTTPASERKLRRKPRTSSGGSNTKRAAVSHAEQQQHPLAQVVAVSGVATASNSSGSSSASGSASESEGPSTLSSREEYQTARLEMAAEEETDRASQGSAAAAAVNVTKIDISSSSAAETAESAATEKNNQGDENNQVELPPPPHHHQIKLLKPQAQNQTAAGGGGSMSRSHTSPGPLDQMVPPPPAQSAVSKGLERGKLTGPPLSPPPMSPAFRLGGGATGPPTPLLPLARLAPDNASQHSLTGAQAKYAGSKHFEIRWHNVRLFARPKSRLPGFVTDNFVYRSVFAGAALGDDSQSVLYGPTTTTTSTSGHLKPPYSPPLNHHKIPPTIDEHAEMKCPHSGGGEFSGPGPEVATITMQGADSMSMYKQQQQQQQPTQQVRCILNNISGQVFSGQMTAVLGPSGVGKTSLLNSLTGRNTLDGTGRVSLIGAQDRKRMSVVTVPQMDVLPGKLSCLEDLQFTSRLKNPQARFDHSRNIARLVRHLHMEKFLHTRIDKLSGGEARRLSIARELLSSPDIMILDEPTSGLDANTCKKIITALRDIVEHSDNILDKPMSIIITIHQPQQEVYQLFHRVYVMAQGGRVVYEGGPQLLLPTLLEQSSLARVVASAAGGGAGDGDDPNGATGQQLNENPAIVAIEVASGEFGESVIEELAAYHESRVYEEFSTFGVGPNALGNFESPMMTPRSMGGGGRTPRKALAAHRKRLNSFDSSLGRPTPQLARRALAAAAAAGNYTDFGAAAAATPPLGSPKMGDRVSSMTSLSFASSYDEYLPEVTSRLKVDKRLRRSVVIKSHFVSHTLTLIRRCWLLTRRDLFLMAIRILGFLLVAGGTVQIFSEALDPNEHQCPQFESEIDDMATYIGSMRDRLAGLLGTLRQANSVHLFFFHLLLCITMVTSALTGLVFPLQMRMFVREYKNGWYSPASFIMSQTIAELPADIIGPLLCLLIAYPLCHQPDSAYHWRLVGYALVLIVTSIICKSQAQIVGAFLMDSVENSVFIACVCVTGPALLSGIPLRVREMSPPLQWVSYGSFLRYAFESLMELRYGYGMCPCDPELVNGPLHASARAIPPHLENLAAGLLELTTGALTNATNSTSAEFGPGAATPTLVGGQLIATAAAVQDQQQENLFLKFLRLTADASNMFLLESREIEQCSSYRSLYLVALGIAPNALVFWASVMLGVFVLSRILTYFAVKTVIKLRRS